MSGDRFGLDGRDFGAVLFDLDGTLLDSIAAVERSWVAFAAEHGIDVRRMQEFHGVPARGVIAALLPHVDQDVAFRRIEAIELSDLDDVTILPGAAEALSALAAQGIPAAIVTSGSAPLARARIAATGLPAPSVVVTADDVDRGKPAPDPYLAAAAGLGVEPTDCLVVEDAPNGIRAGAAAGCATLAVGSTTPREELADVADAVVDGLAAVTFHVEGGRVRVTAG